MVVGQTGSEVALKLDALVYLCVVVGGGGGWWWVVVGGGGWGRVVVGSGGGVSGWKRVVGEWWLF